MSFFIFPFPIHLVCEKLNESGISILVDVTLAGLSGDVENLLQLHRVPFYHFDLSTQSFVKMMEGYIRAMSPAASNVIFILQDELSLYYIF
jgi:hypothetical protein